MARKTYYALSNRLRQHFTYMPGQVMASTEVRISQEFDTPDSTTAGIQEAIDDLPATGGAVVIPIGTHTISTTITIDKDNVTIYGFGCSSIIYLDDASNCNMIDVQSQAEFEMFMLHLDGNKAAQASGSGVVGVDNQDMHLHEVMVVDQKDYGINITYDTTNPHVAILNCDFNGCDRQAVIISTGMHCHIAGNHFDDNLVGIFLQSGLLNRVVDNSLTGSGESGIVIGIEVGDVIKGNVSSANGEYGIVIHTCAIMNVSNNVCYLNTYDNIYIYRTIQSLIKGNTAFNAAMGYNGIHVEGDVGDDADDNLIIDNICSNTGGGLQDIGIYLEGDQYAQDNTVKGNQCLNNVGAQIIDGGQRTKRFEGHTDLFMDVRAEVANFIHQVVGTGANFTVLAPAFTGAQLDVPRNVTVDCTNVGAPSGDISINGIDALGNSVSEDITVTPGGQTVGNLAFSFVSSIDVPSTIPGTDTIQVGNGSKLGLANMFFDATYSVYKCTKNNTDYTGVGNWTISTTYFTVDVSTGGAINNGDDFTIWYRTDTNQVV